MDVDDQICTVQRLEVDGVPVLWAQGPAPLSAGLCFGVGRRDEDFASGGSTRLLVVVPTDLGGPRRSLRRWPLNKRS